MYDYMIDLYTTTQDRIHVFIFGARHDLHQFDGQFGGQFGQARTNKVRDRLASSSTTNGLGVETTNGPTGSTDTGRQDSDYTWSVVICRPSFVIFGESYACPEPLRMLFSDELRIVAETDQQVHV